MSGWLAVAFIVAYALLIAGLIWRWEKRFRKHNIDLDVVNCSIKPGKTTLHMVDDDGTVRGIVVLSRVSWSGQDGTTAEFVDLTRYIQNRTFW